MTSEANHYQVYGKLSDKDNVIKASSNIPGVKFEISKIVEGRGPDSQLDRALQYIRTGN